MAKRHPNYRPVKINRSYSVEEIASLFEIHKNTVRAWVKDGLPTIDSKRPMYILGVELSAFLRARREKHKQPCKPGEIYCVHCRSPKVPAGGMVDCLPLSKAIGNLKAICPDCWCIMNRRVSMARLAQVCGQLAITFTKAPNQVSNSIQPSVNSDLRSGV